MTQTDSPVATYWETCLYYHNGTCPGPPGCPCGDYPSGYRSEYEKPSDPAASGTTETKEETC